MRAVVINCTLKRSPEQSNTEALAAVVIEELRERKVEVETIRAVDLDIPPGVQTDLGPGDPWPEVHRKILDAEIFVMASPTWAGQPSSIAQRVIERMDAMLSETDDDGRPVLYNRVAGVVVTGNEDGAHHVINNLSGALNEFGYTIPGQAWTYWNRGPGPGPSFLESDEGRDWSITTGRAMASNLVAVATALAERPVPAPPS
ncbi:flavodoxin family protein [Actinomadura rudentiformis]|uniref:Flavodoxin family protein n=1 Tax=Actinomadura rudentiformis TaxID=359158 RepID=A0A6H9YVX8_9ACTN|nr:flavodoxin family protein [Actinomadura rudentiformis]KAB2352721.1 flavodoxin family protein [Actinomadura rudentiformis]